MTFAPLKNALQFALALAGMVLVLLVSRVQAWDTWVWATLFFLCLDVRDDEQDLPWLRFLPVGVLVLGVLYITYRYANTAWWSVVKWQLALPRHIWNWDSLFTSLPWNDPIHIRRLFDNPILTDVLKWVYGYGFAFCVWAAIIHSFAARSWKRMLHYSLATHVIQTLLFVPIFNAVVVHEVWWVMGRPDALNRPALFSASEVTMAVLNCFPSMHTSVAFAVMLLALREKGTFYRWGMTIYTAAIIFSTLYLEIHWVLDVAAGLAGGFVAVKLADWVMGANRWRWPFRSEHGKLLSVEEERGVAS